MMGGVQKRHGEKLWIRCKECGVEFSSTGFPSLRKPSKDINALIINGRLCPTICNPCADKHEAKFTTPPPTKNYLAEGADQ
jgi:hypothetical protein